MLKRKLSTLILAATITNLVATPANVFAETLTQNNVIQADEVVEENQSKEATVSKFSLYGSKLLESYNEVFKMDNSNIDSILSYELYLTKYLSVLLIIIFSLFTVYFPKIM